MWFSFPNKKKNKKKYFATLFSTKKARDGYAKWERPSALDKRVLPYNDRNRIFF